MFLVFQSEDWQDLISLVISSVSKLKLGTVLIYLSVAANNSLAYALQAIGREIASRK